MTIGSQRTARIGSQDRRADVGVRGECIDIPINDLVCDAQFQRAYVERHSKSIAKSFHWLRFGRLIVIRIGGRLCIIDGQHRWLAAKMRPEILTVPCEVFDVGDTKEAASAFLDINATRLLVGAADKFRMYVSVGEPAAVELDRLFRMSGYTVTTSGGSHRPKTIGCIRRIHSLARQNLPAISRLWPLFATLGNESGLLEPTVAGLSYIELFATNGSLSDAAWFHRVTQIGQNSLVEAARRLAAASPVAGEKVWARAMLTLINKRVKRKLMVSTLPDC